MDDAKRRRLDLTGHVCPYPFTKSLMTLEKMKVGEELEVLVDYQPALASTPRSLAAYGHRVTEVRGHPNGWIMVVRKGQAPSWGKR
jgi:TusA-related sulfurtransferase